MAHELLQGLAPADAEKVLSLGTKKKISNASSLFRLGELAQYLYLIESGRIRLTLPLQIRGREEEVLIEEKGPGQTVGWSALIPPYRFTLSATTAADTEVVALTPEALHAFFETSPAEGARLCLNLALIVGHRLQTLQAMWLREIQRTVELHAASAGNTQ
jgi:CRP-like cAMP-binding protein